MDILKIAGFAVCAAVLCVTLRERIPAFALILALCASAIIIIAVMPKIAVIIQTLDTFSARLGGGAAYMGVVVKIIGIAYCAEFGAGVCEDAGEKGLAAKVNIAAKALILAAAAPVILSMLEAVTGLY